MRSLPECIHPKVTATEECKHLYTIRVDELGDPYKHMNTPCFKIARANLWLLKLLMKRVMNPLMMN